MARTPSAQTHNPLTVKVHPLTPDRWDDFVRLFGKNGACGGCWCMLWRIGRSEFEVKKGAGTKRLMKKIVVSGATPGLLAYVNREPVGWCAVAPREDYPALERSRVMARVDDQPVWSVSCLFIARGYRRKGVSIELLKAAIKFAKKHRARIVEGYPHIPQKNNAPGAFIWTGTASAFEQAGFTEVARRSPTRPVVRRTVR